MPLLNVNENEWETANSIKDKLLESNPENTNFKIDKTNDKNLQHSFLYIDGKLVCVAQGSFLGIGTFGKVKLCQTQDGKEFAVKIEEVPIGSSQRNQKEKENNILRKLERLKGTMIRDRGATKKYN